MCQCVFPGQCLCFQLCVPVCVDVWSVRVPMGSFCTSVVVCLSAYMYVHVCVYIFTFCCCSGHKREGQVIV